MTFQNILITGANRGIGLELARQFLALKPKNLIATTRLPSVVLDQLKSANANLHVLPYDATDFDSYASFVAQVQQIVGSDEGLDLLVNNAGIYIRDNLDTVTPKNILANIETNSVAPLMLTKELLPLLKVSFFRGIFVE